MRRMYVSVPVAVCLLSVSAAFAQNQNFGQTQQQPGQQQGQFAGQDQTAANPSDMQIAAWLLVGNHEEVALAKLAQQHAHSQKVKDIAREMDEQHMQFIGQLHRFTGARAETIGAQQNAGQQFGSQQAGAQQPAVQQPGAEQPGARQSVAGQAVAGQPANQTLTSSITNNPNATGMGQGLNFVAVIQQMGQQCEQSLAREMSEYQGAEFDKAYAGQQIGAHLAMLTKLRVLRQHASPQLQQVLAQGEKTTQHHLDQFKQLMKSLESDKSSG